MKCNGPLHGWYSRERTDAGKRRVVFQARDGYADRRVAVPCGKCLGCKLERSREWAVRCVHEAQMWRRNAFVTLTYNDKNVPRDGSLRPEDFVRFMKRLRLIRPGVRFLQAGEYGKYGRPHHHCLLFNCDFDDKVFLSERKGGTLFRSPLLERLWPYGFSSTAEVTFESAAYVARYTLKKVGEVQEGGRRAPYMTMSRRPGIGAFWFNRFGRSDVLPRDMVITRGGAVSKPPRFYDELRKRFDPEGYALAKSKRVAATLTEHYAEENTERRGADKDFVLKDKVDKFLDRRI